ncbi:MAG: glycosyltransferase family 4 protein [Chloroflexi bacterium]|nr:glycosyltransferase family 4 protein [Chloroflexota bacterium]
MHILLLTAYFPPDIGSASHLFYELGQVFAGRGHTVSVVTGFPGYHAQGDLARYRGRRWMKEAEAGMDVYRVAVPQVARDTPIGRGLWQFSCAASFALAGLRVPRPDVALVYSPPLPLALSAHTWRTLRRVPYVVNIQDLFPQSAIDLGLLRQKPLIRFFESLERFVYRQADAITVHSAGNRQHVLGRMGRDSTTVVMHNSVDVEHIRPGGKDNDLSRELGLGNRFVASFAGVMGHSQDLDTILAAAQLLQSHEQIHFLLVGDGVEKDRCVAKSREMKLTNVTWLPMQPRERYPHILHSSDAGLTTLHKEVKTPVVPSKILSNMAAGLPVVAALDPLGDAPRLIAEAKAGYSVSPEDPQALAGVLLDLYRDPALCRRLGENGRRYAELHLSPAAVAEQYEGLFKSALSKKSASVAYVP